MVLDFNTQKSPPVVLATGDHEGTDALNWIKKLKIKTESNNMNSASQGKSCHFNMGLVGDGHHCMTHHDEIHKMLSSKMLACAVEAFRA
eukprot:scaffold99272_cov71-Cyclotella_meneghiniana.AAC.1